MATTSRRRLIQMAGATTLAYSAGFWRTALAAPAVTRAGPYGPLGALDIFGVRLPAGFTARLIGLTGEPVPGTAFDWVGGPDGAATFATPDGGWIYAANSELNGTAGGAAAIRFDPAGNVVDAYRILGGTKWNCAGGATPWGTWLSGEEFRHGNVWECDPSRPGQGVRRPLLGTFAHEASVVDPATGWIYLTEDDSIGRFYRFRPARYGDLATGVLEAAAVGAAGQVSWIAVGSNAPERSKRTTEFNRGEGAWFSGGHVYFSTTGDDKVWAYDAVGQWIEVIYDAAQLGAEAPLRRPDNITVHPSSSDVFVGEDSDDLQLVLLDDDAGGRVAAPFLQLVGHGNGESGSPGQDADAVTSSSWAKVSEITGLAFSPDGRRLYVTSQRGTDGQRGMTFEVTGPFRQ